MADATTDSGSGLLSISVLTPTGVIAEVESDAVTAPGEQGEFEVLAGHIPFLTSMHPGVLVLGEAQRDYFAVSRGYLRVNADNQVEILVEQAVAAADVDRDAADAELQEATRDANSWSGPQNAEWANIKARLDWAQAQLDAAKLASN